MVALVVNAGTIQMSDTISIMRKSKIFQPNGGINKFRITGIRINERNRIRKIAQNHFINRILPLSKGELFFVLFSGISKMKIISNI